MRTVSQVTKLTGVSARALQYYDEIGLLKPTALTANNYRLYDDEALLKLQQILFFKELGFTLKEIHEFLSRADFDQIAAFKKQKELLLLQRNRTDRLIELLGHLEKGEQCMSFKEFDLSEYIQALEDFKKNSTNEVMKYWGSIENFNMFIDQIKKDEPKVAKIAIREFGSIEKYTEAMKYNLEHFSEIMEKTMAGVPERSTLDQLFDQLTSDLTMDVASNEIQNIIMKIISVSYQNKNLIGDNYCDVIIETYSNDYFSRIYDTKHQKGASEYLVQAFQYYKEHNA